MSHGLKGRTAIAGLGITQQGKVYDHNHVGFAVEAVRLALEDAGLTRERSRRAAGQSRPAAGATAAWARSSCSRRWVCATCGCRRAMNAGGATAGAMIQQAAQAIDAGLCNTVACVFSDAPLKPPTAAGAKARRRRRLRRRLRASRAGSTRRTGSSASTPCTPWSRSATCTCYGTTNDHLGAIAVAERAVGATAIRRRSSTTRR